MNNSTKRVVEEYNFELGCADVVYFRNNKYKLDKDIVYEIPLDAGYKSCLMNLFLEKDGNMYQFSLSEGYRSLYDFDDKRIYKIPKSDFTYCRPNNETLPLNIKCYEDKSIKGKVATKELGNVTLFEFDKDGHLDFNGDVFGQLFKRQNIALDGEKTKESGIRTKVDDIHPELMDKYVASSSVFYGDLKVESLKEHQKPVHDSKPIIDEIDRLGYELDRYEIDTELGDNY